MEIPPIINEKISLIFQKITKIFTKNRGKKIYDNFGRKKNKNIRPV